MSDGPNYDGQGFKDIMVTLHESGVVVVVINRAKQLVENVSNFELCPDIVKTQAKYYHWNYCRRPRPCFRIV